MTKPVITTRAGKGSALTWTEGDTNLTNLRDATISVTDGTNSKAIDLNGTIQFTGGTNVTTSVNTSTGAVTINSTTPPAGSNTQIQYNNSGALGASSSLTWDGSALSAPNLVATNSSGSEGGEIRLALAASGTTLNTSVTIDIYQNKLRFFETGGTARGAYIDLTAAGAGVGTNLLSGGGGSGTVTSVGGTGTVNGLTLTGTVTTSGSLTLGGTLDLSSPPAIGGTTAAAITGTTITANTAFSGPHNGTVGATTPSTGAFTTLTANGTTNAAKLVLGTTALSSTAWTTAGIGIKATAATFTDTSSTGTVASSYIHALGGSNLASTNTITVTDAANLYVAAPIASTNTTITNRWAILSNGNIKASQFSGALAATTISASQVVTLSPADSAVTISPTGTGSVTISPVAGLTINPTVTGTINNTSIGATTATTGRFTTIESTMASGNPPFIVASTTNVANLNASSLNGATFASPGSIGSTTASTGTFTTLTVNASNDLRLADSDSSNYVGFKAPTTVSANKIWTLPSADGTNGQVLTTNGTGTLSWSTSGGGITLDTTNDPGNSYYIPLIDGATGAGTLTTLYRKIPFSATQAGRLGATSFFRQGDWSSSFMGSNYGASIISAAANFTDTTSSGTQASAAIVGLGAPTVNQNSATTITDMTNLYVAAPIAGTNTTFTNNWSIYAEGRIKGSAIDGTPIGSTTSSTGKFTSLQFTNTIEPPYALTAGAGAATLAPNAANGSIQTFNMSTATSLTFNGFTSAVAGQSITIIVTNNTISTISSTMKWAGGLKTLSGTSGAIDIISVYFDGTNYYASLGRGYV